MNDLNWGFLIYLMSPDFTFVDETTGISTQGRAHEESLADSSLYCHYRGAEFDFHVSSRTQTDECLVVCGLVEMRLYREHDAGFIVNDETCLTACPQAEDGLWRLTEWRILRSVPPAQTEEGFEVATWGEVKRKEWSRDFCTD